MIEIVFGDSACASLKIAQSYGDNEHCIGSGIIVMEVLLNDSDGSQLTEEEIAAAKEEAERNEQLAWENATPLGGSPGDVYSFSLCLSIGDISEQEPGALRQQVLEQQMNVYPHIENEQVVQTWMKQAKDNLQTVLSRAKAGEALRIWYSNQPDEMCGMYWFMNHLAQADVGFGELFLVKLPEWKIDKETNTLVKQSSWGEVEAFEWYGYSNRQELVSLVFCQSCSAHWQKLQQENSPLRAVLNGQLVSMPDTLYDQFILQEIMAEEEVFHQAMVIGRVLGNYHLGVGDAWIAQRMEKFIQEGLLIPIEEAPAESPVYHRRLKKTN